MKDDNKKNSEATGYFFIGLLILCIAVGFKEDWPNGLGLFGLGFVGWGIFQKIIDILKGTLK